MVVGHKEVCEKCGKEYYQGCLREDEYFICDKCRGYKEKEPEKPLTREEQKQLLVRYSNLKYGGTEIKPLPKPSGLQLELEQAVKELMEARKTIQDQMIEIEHLRKQIPLDKHTKHEFLKMVEKALGFEENYLSPR